MCVVRFGLNTFSFVVGFTPPCAIVAAIIASWSAVTPREHWRVYRSSDISGSSYMRSKFLRSHAIDLLLKLLSLSDLYSSPMSFISEPVSDLKNDVIALHFASESPLGSTIEQAHIAPAFTSGVDGCSFSSRIAIMELNGSPVASAPIFCSISSALYWFITRIAVATFDIDSIPKAYVVSPALIISPFVRHTDIPKRLLSMPSKYGM